MSDNFIEVKMYECKFCHKLFKTNTKHSCKWNPEKHNCLTCTHCIGFVKGQGQIFSHNFGFVDYDPSYFKCDMNMGGYNDFDELAQSGWKTYCEEYVEVKCNDFIKHYADVMAKNTTEIVRQITMEIDNKIERFMVSEVQNYADKQEERLTVTVNAKMIYEAVKRQTPKKVGFDYRNCYFVCPSCGRTFDEERDNFCSRCGQAFMKTR